MDIKRVVVAVIVIVVVVAAAVVSVLVGITAHAIVPATAAVADHQQTVQSESLTRPPQNTGKSRGESVGSGSQDLYIDI